MSYGTFTLDQLRHAFGLKVRDEALFDPVGTLEPSPWLRECMNRGQDLAVTSEKARGEFIVVPLLMECRALLGHDLRIFSGLTFNVDPARGLQGECDYVLGRSASSVLLQAPLMVIVEAKKHDIEEGLGQCAAQLIAAQLFNEREKRPVPFVYGCVTNGHSWQFVKLAGDAFSIHSERLPIQQLSRVLWFVVQCIRDLDREAAALAAA